MRLANLSDDTVKIDKGHAIALLQPVDSVPSKEKYEKEKLESSVASVTEVDTGEGYVVDDIELPEHLQKMINQIPSEITQSETYKIKKYEKCFMGTDGVLGETDLVTPKIDTGNARPVKQKLRIPPIHLQEEADRKIEKLLKQGIIKPSQSACNWSFPLVAVRKKCGGLRLCTDYRKINAIMLNKDAYPLPKINDCLNALSGMCYFSALDLASGYNQVLMDPVDKSKNYIFYKI